MAEIINCINIIAMIITIIIIIGYEFKLLIIKFVQIVYTSFNIITKTICPFIYNVNILFIIYNVDILYLHRNTSFWYFRMIEYEIWLKSGVAVNKHRSTHYPVNSWNTIYTTMVYAVSCMAVGPNSISQRSFMQVYAQ